MKIIGLGGSKESGKDTLAEAVSYFYPNQCRIIGMSEALHGHLMTLNPLVSEDQRYADIVNDVGYRKAKEVPEVRRLQMILGTEVGRSIDEDMWVKETLKKVRYLAEEGKTKILFITGIRYPNELEMLKMINGLSLYINRVGLEKNTSHTSETSLSAEDFDVVLENDDLKDFVTAGLEFISNTYGEGFLESPKQITSRRIALYSNKAATR